VGEASELTNGTSAAVAREVGGHPDLTDLVIRMDDVSVRRGENGGKTLPHKNIVREIVRLGGWSGRAESFSLPANDPGLGSAILVQATGAGPILAATKQ